jgi:tetratricopeptide (TPR) repeat protein
MAKDNPKDPETFEGWYSLGESLLDRSKYAEAAEAFQKCVSMEPDSDDSWNSLGYALVQQGKARESIAASKKALELNRGNGEALYNLGHAYHVLGEYKTALSYYEQYRDKEHGKSQYLQEIDDCREKLGLPVLDPKLLDKFKKIVLASKRIAIKQVAVLLSMPDDDLIKQVIYWENEKRMGVRIDGSDLLIDPTAAAVENNEEVREITYQGALQQKSGVAYYNPDQFPTTASESTRLLLSAAEIIASMVRNIELVKEMVVVVTPAPVPEILEKAATVAYQNPKTKVFITTKWDVAQWGDLLKQMTLLTNISVRTMKQPVEYYALNRDGKEIILGVLSDEAGGAEAITSTNPRFVKLYSQFIGPMFQAGSQPIKW